MCCMSSCEVAKLPPLNHCLALVPAYVDVADSRSVELDVLASSAFFNSSDRTVVMSLDSYNCCNVSQDISHA